MNEMRAGWTSPNGDITIQVWDLGWHGVQVREVHHGANIPAEIHLYATEAEARTMARASAQIIRFNQKPPADHPLRKMFDDEAGR